MGVTTTTNNRKRTKVILPVPVTRGTALSKTTLTKKYCLPRRAIEAIPIKRRLTDKR